MGEALLDFFVAELAILNVERVDRGHEELRRRRHLLLELGAAKNNCLVLIDPLPQIFPHPGIRTRKVNMATPEPWAVLFVELNQGQRLRVVNNDEIVIEKVADAVLIKDLLKNFLFNA